MTLIGHSPFKTKSQSFCHVCNRVWYRVRYCLKTSIYFVFNLRHSVHPLMKPPRGLITNPEEIKPSKKQQRQKLVNQTYSPSVHCLYLFHQWENIRRSLWLNQKLLILIATWISKQIIKFNSYIYLFIFSFKDFKKFDLSNFNSYKWLNINS